MKPEKTGFGDNTLSKYRKDIKQKMSDMTKEEIKSWNNACKDALEPTGEMKKSFIAIKKEESIKIQAEKEWQNKNSEQIKTFFKTHWNNVDIDCDRRSVIWNLSTMLFDSHGDIHDERHGELLSDMKETFPDLYVEVLEGYILGYHDT